MGNAPAPYGCLTWQGLSGALPTLSHLGATAKRYGDAAHWLCECISRQPSLQWPHVMLACAYAQSGQLEEARAAAAAVLRINPGYTIESSKCTRVYKDPKDLEHYIDGMRKAGLPES